MWLPNRMLLFLNNITSHPAERDLTWGEIKTVFLLPNVTPKLGTYGPGGSAVYKTVLQKTFGMDTIRKTREVPLLTT